MLETCFISGSSSVMLPVQITAEATGIRIRRRSAWHQVPYRWELRNCSVPLDGLETLIERGLQNGTIEWTAGSDFHFCGSPVFSETSKYKKPANPPKGTE